MFTTSAMSCPSYPAPPDVRTALPALEDLDEASWTRLADYAGLLLEGNEVQDLVAPCDGKVLWRRHLFDSLVLLPWIPPGSRSLDLGSGGGLPGLVLASVRPDDRFTLLEATQRKAAFLEQTAKALELSRVSVAAIRAEAAGHDPGLRGQFDRVVCRAVAPLQVLVEYALPLLKTGGMLVAAKGRTAEEEVGTADRALAELGGRMEGIHPAPALEGKAGFTVVVEKHTPTPDRFPRRTGLPRKRPL